MNPYATSAHIRQMKEEYGVNADKNFGQNFLIDSNILSAIVSGAEIDETDGVIEVGPGLGALTWELSQKAGKVLGVEIDKRLIPILSRMFEDAENVGFIQSDILKCDEKELIETHFGEYDNVSLVANLPYYITTPIIMKFLESDVKIHQLVVMVQKEVADRMCAKEGTKDYGALSVAVQYRCETEIVTNVDPHCFMPQPKVTSTVIRLKMREKPVVEVQDEKVFFKVVSAAFGQRRKTFANAICNMGGFNLSKEDVYTMLREMGLKEDIRGEKLNIQQFAQISDMIVNKKFK